MFRNLFALFSTLMLGTGAASASTADSTKPALEQRIQAAQKTIDTLIGTDEEQDSKPGDKVAYWNDWKNGWKNWGNNWSNGWNNWSNGWGNYVMQTPKGTTTPSLPTTPSILPAPSLIGPPAIATPPGKPHK